MVEPYKPVDRLRNKEKKLISFLVSFPLSCGRGINGQILINIIWIIAFQAYGEYVAGTIDEETRFDIIRNACPGQGACGGMYTANTMAT